MTDAITTQEAKPKGTPSKGTLQSYLQNFTKEAIECVIDIMRNSRNENLKFGAAKLILDKSIADIKAVELTGENGGSIKLNIISGADYISALGKSASASTAGATYGSTSIQGADLAPESPKDNDSNQSVSEVEST